MRVDSHRLTRERMRQGLSIDELAEVAGVDFGLLESIERGVAVGDGRVLERVAEALGVAPLDIGELRTS